MASVMIRTPLGRVVNSMSRTGLKEVVAVRKILCFRCNTAGRHRGRRGPRGGRKLGARRKLVIAHVPTSPGHGTFRSPGSSWPKPAHISRPAALRGPVPPPDFGFGTGYISPRASAGGIGWESYGRDSSHRPPL